MVEAVGIQCFTTPHGVKAAFVFDSFLEDGDNAASAHWRTFNQRNRIGNVGFGADAALHCALFGRGRHLREEWLWYDVGGFRVVFERLCEKVACATEVFLIR